ncbi:hypothetical protein K493DRAFT_23164 [Basidiobolus meristosporus CBS 931.73]|uniref:Uncharacterized protein n=1 Tax=Basidiobolus meristosporus CBS 931.73 TaxID=1314790 RepID=A0A1Y1Z832_9FUNG|nr:hypothetical protein K493DRAFT_23164 [Basidiobolus meristosporus CBS 931.73]|eukprot:ORY06274.1 hypothetical protein K493DRAFT_23164 [Basidiobolus meristosporus CBS 931.73]
MNGALQRVNSNELEAGSSCSALPSATNHQHFNKSVLVRAASIICLAILSVLCILLLITNIPGLRVPATLKDAKYDVEVLKEYMLTNGGQCRILVIFSLLYLWKQTFCVPGSILMVYSSVLELFWVLSVTKSFL